MKTANVPARAVPQRLSAFGMSSDWRTLNLGRIIQDVLPVLADYRAFKPEAVGLYWPARSTNYGQELVLVPPENRSAMYLTFRIRRGDDGPRLIVRNRENRVFDWSAGTSRYLTFTLEPQGTPNSVRGILWLMEIVAASVYRNGVQRNLDNWGTQDIGDLSILENKSLAYVLQHVGPKWWPFCRAIWNQLPNALMPIQSTPMVAAYFVSVLKTVRVGSSSRDFEKCFGPEGQMNDLIKAGAKSLTFADNPAAFPADQFSSINSNPALTMFGGIVSEEQFWVRRKQIMLKGYEV